MTTLSVPVTGQLIQLDLPDYIEYYTQGLSICTKPDGYKTIVFTKGNHKTKYLWRVMLNCPPHLEIDHIDGNTLNNSRSNLRLSTSQQNKFNTKHRCGDMLTKGVNKHGSGFKATITVDYKQIYLGTFRSYESAAKAYKDAAEKYQGQFAVHISRGI